MGQQEGSMTDRVATWFRAGFWNERRILGGFLGIVLVVSGLGAIASDQEARPPAAAGNSLARYVPRQDLIFMLEYEGLVERRLTVVATCRQQGRNVLDYLTSCFQADREGHAIPSLLPVTEPAIKVA
jgi:hypothetical protein